MEVAEIQHDVRAAVREFKGQDKLGELKPIWKLVVAIGWVLVALGLGLEWWGDARINSVSTDLDTVNQALVQRAEGDAINAGKSAHNAFLDATVARDSSSDAQKNAKGARLEADSLTQEITAAKEQSADASSKAADAVSRLAGAEQQLAEQTQKEADATQRELAAEEALRNLKTPRSLINTTDLASALRAFSGTEYTLNVFADQESINLTKEIGNTLDAAGWIRKEPKTHSIGGVSYFNVFSDKLEDSVPSCIEVGVNVHVVSQVPADVLQSTPAPNLPKEVQAADALHNAIIPSISPSDESNVGRVIEVDKKKNPNIGDGPVIVCVGKKP
jgi:hypothetical protein